MCNVAKSNNYVTFLVQNSEHRLTEVSCNPLDRNRENDYITVEFYATVLDKYRNSNISYCIDGNRITYLNQWILRFNLNTNTVTVLLTDLGVIPYEEQCHWKAFAKAPKL